MQDTTTPTGEQVERAIVARFNAETRTREARAYAEYTGAALIMGDALPDDSGEAFWYVVRWADVPLMEAAGYEAV